MEQMREIDNIEDFIEEQLRSGRYSSRDEIVNAALAQMQERERKLQALRSEIRPAIDAFERGEGEELNISDIIAECEAEYSSAHSKSKHSS